MIFLFFIGIKLLLNFYSFNNSKYINPYKSEVYSKYIQNYEGKITDKKQSDIEKEYEAVNQAKFDLENALVKYRGNTLTKSEFEEIKSQAYVRINNAELFYYIYNQYIYAKENPDQRYILERDGWNTLLSRRVPDFLMILCIIVILTPVFCMEFENSMYSLLLSSINGKYKVAIVKSISGIIMATFIVITFSLIDYFSADLIIGLKNGNYPLQSLEYFENCEYSISLLNTYITIVLFRIFAAVFLAIIVYFISIVTKETIITLFTALTLVLIPFIIIQKSSILYYLPLPSGFFSATGFFRGDVHSSQLDLNYEIEPVKEFAAISKETLLVLLFLLILLMLILFVLSIKQYGKLTLNDFTNGIKKNKLSRIKKIMSMLIIVIVNFQFFSCTKVDLKENGTFVYQTYNSAYTESEEYSIQLDVEDGSIIATNKSTGENVQLIRDPVKDNEDKEIKSIFADRDNCYYLEQNSTSDEIMIYKINMTNFEQTVIYSSVSENSADFFGLAEKIAPETGDDFHHIIHVFVFDKYIYYEDNSNLIQINRKTNNKKAVVNNISPNVSILFKDGFIYYIDNKYNLNIYDENLDKIEEISSVYIDSFTVEDNQLRYEDLSDKKKYTYELR